MPLKTKTSMGRVSFGTTQMDIKGGDSHARIITGTGSKKKKKKGKEQEEKEIVYYTGELDLENTRVFLMFFGPQPCMVYR